MRILWASFMDGDNQVGPRVPVKMRRRLFSRHRYRNTDMVEWTPPPGFYENPAIGVWDESGVLVDREPLVTQEKPDT